MTVLVAATACASDAAPVDDDRRSDDLGDAELVLWFDDVAVPGDSVPSAANDGTAEVSVSVATWAGGRLAWDRGWDGGGLRTPAPSTLANAPAAALVVAPLDAVGLEPGRREFLISVDFTADAAQPGRDGDDGDNLLQRGRYDAEAQYKLQLDHGTPGCRVAGDRGAVELRADVTVEPGHWYRLSCLRAGGEVVLRLSDLEGDMEAMEWVATGDPGDLRFAGAPVSIGAKVTDAGRIDPAGTDQFHGVIDRVVVDIR